MDVWLWVLIALCAAGIVLAASSSLAGLIATFRLMRRLSALSQSSFVTKLESLQIQLDRLSRVSTDVHELERRAKVALDTLCSAPEIGGFRAIGVSWRDWESQLRGIIAELS